MKKLWAWLFLMLLLFSCRPKTQPLVYMQWGDPKEVEIGRQLIKSFEEKYPEIKVQIIHAPDYHSKLQTMLAGGTPPDVFYVDAWQFDNLVEKGVLLDLAPFIQKDSREVKINDFYPQLLKVFTYRNDLYGLPKDFTTMVLYYNRDLFDDAGLAYPDESWDWKKFQEAAGKLTTEKGKYGFKQFGIDPGQDYGFAVYQNGGRILNEDFTRCLLDQPEAYEAIQFLADLRNKYNYAPTAMEARDAPVGLELGGAAMSFVGRWVVPRLRKVTRFKWEVAPLPKGKQRATLIYTVSYGIAKDSKQPENAWQLIKFLTGAEGQKLQCQLGLAVPSRKSVAESGAFLEVYPPQNNRVYLDSLEYGYYMPYFSQWNEVQYLINSKLDPVWIGKKTAQEACKEAADEVNGFLEKYYQKEGNQPKL